jgi:hypothetical protein
MFKLRDEIIKAIISGLRIDDNPFIYHTILEMIAHIKDEDLKIFYKKLFSGSFRYTTGMDRVSIVAESFASDCVKNDDELLNDKAKEIYDIARAMNDTVWKEHSNTGVSFEKLMEAVKFVSIPKDTIAIMDNIKPYYSHKLFATNINIYQTAKEAINAIKTAISNTRNKEVSHIQNKKVAGLIKSAI